MTGLLCTGLALLGLCIPLPGHSRLSVEQSGWNLLDKEQPGWSSSAILASGTYVVSVLVTGEGDKVKGVVVTEERAEDRSNPKSPLRSLLASACKTVEASETCVVGAARFQRVNCMTGWLLVPVGFNSEKALANCARWGPFFEDARKPKR